MLLRYVTKNAHMKCVPLIPAEGVSFKRSQVQLLPGVNEVSEDEYAAIKPLIKYEIDNKIIFPITIKVEDSKKAPSGKAKTLEQLPVSFAETIIKNCNNPDTLKKWYQTEMREDVLHLIIKRMNECKINSADVKLGEEGDVDIDDLNVDDDSGDDDEGTTVRKRRTRKGKEDKTADTVPPASDVEGEGAEETGAADVDDDSGDDGTEVF